MLRPTVLVLGATAAIMALVQLDNPVANNAIFRIAVLVILSVSWNMMANAGLFSLGHSAFWGLAGYAAMFSAKTVGGHFALSFVLPAIVCALAGAGLALATGRLRGIYFAIATLALSEGLRIVAVMLADVTGGSAGSYLNAALRPSMIVLFQLSVVLAGLAVLVAVALSRTRIQVASRTMRDNEDAAQMLGVNPLRYRMIVSAIAGTIAAFGGALNAWYTGYITPQIAFDLHYAVFPQIATILGGIYTLAGPVIGSVAIVLINEVIRLSSGSLNNYNLLIYGLILIACIRFLPDGVEGIARRARRARSA